MIGNLDWSMQAGPAGRRLLPQQPADRAAGAALFVPVPYDFDYSGLVDAPYAVPPEGFTVRASRPRYYRGYCRHNAEALAAAAEFRAQRPAIEAMFAQIPG